MADTDSDQGCSTVDRGDKQSAGPEANGRGYQGLPHSFAGRASQRGTRKPRSWEYNGPILGVGDPMGAGDSYLVADVLPGDLAEVAFEKLRTEVKWNTMYHRGAFMTV